MGNNKFSINSRFPHLSYLTLENHVLILSHNIRNIMSTSNNQIYRYLLMFSKYQAIVFFRKEGGTFAYITFI